MAIIVKGEITISKGFNHWKEMIFSEKEKMARISMQCIPIPAIFSFCEKIISFQWLKPFVIVISPLTITAIFNLRLHECLFV